MITNLHADEEGDYIRKQVQRDRRSSVTATIVARMGSQSPAPFPCAMQAVRGSAQTSTRAGTPEFSHIAEHALHQLHEAHAYVKAAELQGEAESHRDPIRPAALSFTPVHARHSPARYSTAPEFKAPIMGDSTTEHLSRLTPSMAQAPSRTNTIDRHSTVQQYAAVHPTGAKAGTSQGPACSPGLQQVHFNSYVEPHTFDVAPPATPHPSKGLLNPPHDGGSPDSSYRVNGMDALLDGEQQRQQVSLF